MSTGQMRSTEADVWPLREAASAMRLLNRTEATNPSKVSEAPFGTACDQVD